MRSKCCAFRCVDDSKYKLEGISLPYSKNINIDEVKNCLDGEEHQQKCDNYIIRSFNHEI